MVRTERLPGKSGGNSIQTAAIEKAVVGIRMHTGAQHMHRKGKRSHVVPSQITWASSLDLVGDDASSYPPPLPPNEPLPLHSQLQIHLVALLLISVLF